MRRTSLGMIVLAACGGSNEGALLIVHGGPDSAARIEIVLANANSAKIEEVDDQRVRAGDFAQEGVRYYRQRAIAGEVIGVAQVDGFRVRIEPNPDLIDEQELIPFLVAYDGNEQIIGIGSYLEGGDPAKIEIPDDLLRVYEITMVPMSEVTGEAGLVDGEVLPVSCGSFRSGLAFQPGGVQLRLLLPDRSQDDRSIDASDRVLDMDCDGALANEGDCDDLRGEFHAGATESCDGMDYDCDFRRLEIVTCEGITTTCGETEGVQLCVDLQNGSTTGACQATPECSCDQGGPCPNKCVLAFQGGDGSPIMTCDPQTSQALSIPNCQGDCIVEVIQRPNQEFAAEIALENDTNFTTKLPSVIDKIHLRVRHVGPNPVTGAAGTSVGSVFLAVTPARTNLPFQLGIALDLDQGSDSCEVAGTPDMVCILQP